MDKFNGTGLPMRIISEDLKEEVKFSHEQSSSPDAFQAPLRSPQEDAEKHLNLFPNLRQGDSSSSLVTVQKCCVSH